MRKRIVALALCGLMAFTGSITVFAADTTTDDPIVISPQMENIKRTAANLSVDVNGNASITCSVYGFSGITNRVKISATLQRYVNGSWVTLETFADEKDSWYMSLNDTCKVSKGYTYRVQAYVYAYSDSSSEMKIATSNEVKY